MLLPVAWLFWLSFLADDGSFSLEHYRRMLEQPSYGRTFLTTFEVSLLTTAICIVLGYPLAYALSQLPPRVANLCLIAVLLPFWTSLLVRTYAWLVLLQRKGLINNWGMRLGWWDEPLALVHNLTGTLIGMVHIMLPFLVLPLYARCARSTPTTCRPRPTSAPARRGRSGRCSCRCRCRGCWPAR